jgi:hypothetical protein
MSVNSISSQSFASLSDSLASQEAPSLWAAGSRLLAAAKVTCTEYIATTYPLDQEVCDDRTTTVRDLVFLIARIGLYIAFGILNYSWQLIM